MPKVNIVVMGCPITTDREPLGISMLVLIRGKYNTLYDVGTFGTQTNLRNSLTALGLTTNDIHKVILSHLHWDHALFMEPFKHAEIILSAKEHAQASDPKSRDRAMPAYMIDVLSCYKVRFPAGDEEIEPGVQLMEFPGHTAGFLAVKVNDGPETHIIAGDAIPHAAMLVSGVHERGWFDQKMADQNMRKVAAMAGKSGIIYPAHDRPFRYDVETRAVKYTESYSLTLTCKFSASGEITTVKVSA